MTIMSIYHCDNWLKTNRLSLNVNKTSYIIISYQKNASDIKLRDSILTKVSTVKFLGVTLDKNLTVNEHPKKITTKISNSICVMRRLYCQLPVTILWCISIRLMLYWHGEDLEVLMLLSLSVLTGEHANYSQIITKRSIFHSIMITLLYEKLSRNALNFHQYFKDKFSSHQPSHMHNTKIVILMLHFSFIQKTQKLFIK